MSFAELLVILIVALIVLGPERLPSLAEKLGRLIAKTRSLTDGLKQEFDQQLNQDQLKQNQQRAEQADKLYKQDGVVDNKEKVCHPERSEGSHQP